MKVRLRITVFMFCRVGMIPLSIIYIQIRVSYWMLKSREGKVKYLEVF